jgi:hypothetical protein
MPMGLTSTPFISYHDIRIDEIDLFEDAFGIYPEFSDVIEILRQLNIVAGESLTSDLIDKIRKQH